MASVSSFDVNDYDAVRNELWTYHGNDVTVSNESFNIVSGKISRGLVPADTLFWCEGLPDWVRLDDVPGLEKFLPVSARIDARVSDDVKDPASDGSGLFGLSFAWTVTLFVAIVGVLVLPVLFVGLVFVSMFSTDPDPVYDVNAQNDLFAAVSVGQLAAVSQPNGMFPEDFIAQTHHLSDSSSLHNVVLTYDSVSEPDRVSVAPSVHDPAVMFYAAYSLSGVCWYAVDDLEYDTFFAANVVSSSGCLAGNAAEFGSDWWGTDFPKNPVSG